MTSASWVQIRRWCRCGGSMYAWSDPPGAAEAAAARFAELHAGEGHGPATAQEAANARKRQKTAARRAARAVTAP